MVESLVTRVNSAIYDEEFSGMLTAGPLAGVNVIPVMVAVNASIESPVPGAGGVAVSTSERLALPPPQLAVQPPPGTPLQEESRVLAKTKKQKMKSRRFMEYPTSQEFARPGAERGALRLPQDRSYRCCWL